VRVRPIHFVPDVDEAMRFYKALGLEVQARARTGHWIELTASGGEFALHDTTTAADGRGRERMLVSFIAEEPLEALERRLRAAGFSPQGTVVDQEWGRSLFVRAPDGTVVQVDEQDPDLYM
jgi:catechol 2,3-dioxygenase-like lactoylglutathione lyase family enzyme